MFDVVKNSSHLIMGNIPDGIIVKYDYKGNIIWKKIFGGDGDDLFKDIILNGDMLITIGGIKFNKWAPY